MITMIQILRNVCHFGINSHFGIRPFQAQEYRGNIGSRVQAQEYRGNIENIENKLCLLIHVL